MNVLTKMKKERNTELFNPQLFSISTNSTKKKSKFSFAFTRTL